MTDSDVPANERTYIRNPETGLPVAEVVGDCLVFKVRQHGRRYTVVTSLDEIAELMNRRLEPSRC